MHLNRTKTTVLTFCLAVLVLLNLPEGVVSRFKLFIGSIFVPFFGVSGGINQTANKAGYVVLPRSELIRRIETLEQENQILKIQAMQAKSIWEENNLLRSNVAWMAQSPWKLKLARVVGRDPASWWRGLHIDVGLRDGIRVNLPVITADGLVGRISEVGHTRSMVVILGDPKCRVSAYVPEAGDSGIISPSTVSLFNGRYVELMYLTRGSELRPGQAVYTSGFGGIFPKGILIGHIVDVRTADGLYLQARVQVSANLNTLDQVWVVLQ